MNSRLTMARLWPLFVVAGLVFAGVMSVLVIAFVLVANDSRSIGTELSITGSVDIVATAEPVGSGVLVRQTITLSSGRFPDEITVDRTSSDSSNRYTLQTEPNPDTRFQQNAKSRIVDVMLNGAPLAAGASAKPQGSSLTLSFLVERRDDGLLFARFEPPFAGVDVSSLDLTVTGAVATCLVPADVIRRGIPWLKPCTNKNHVRVAKHQFKAYSDGSTETIRAAARITFPG